MQTQSYDFDFRRPETQTATTAVQESRTQSAHPAEDLRSHNTLAMKLLVLVALLVVGCCRGFVALPSPPSASLRVVLSSGWTSGSVSRYCKRVVAGEAPGALLVVLGQQSSILDCSTLVRGCVQGRTRTVSVQSSAAESVVRRISLVSGLELLP